MRELLKKSLFNVAVAAAMMLAASCASKTMAQTTSPSEAPTPDTTVNERRDEARRQADQARRLADQARSPIP